MYILKVKEADKLSAVVIKSPELVNSNKLIDKLRLLLLNDLQQIKIVLYHMLVQYFRAILTIITLMNMKYILVKWSTFNNGIICEYIVGKIPIKVLAKIVAFEIGMSTFIILCSKYVDLMADMKNILWDIVHTYVDKLSGEA